MSGWRGRGGLRWPAALFVCVALGQGLASTGLTQETGSYKGREIAHVMSYRGAPWLERESRQAEEDTDALHALLPIEEGDVVVDLGCGSGFHARRMARVVGEGGIVFCVDIQPEMLEIAGELAEQNGITNISPILSTEHDPKLPEGEIDLILLVDVYHEFSQPDPMLEEIRRALAPDGVVALVEFRLEGDTAAHIKTEHRMSVEQVMKEWEPAGFELVERIDSLPTQHLFLFGRGD